jgi:hypothetical protein
MPSNVNDVAPTVAPDSSVILMKDNSRTDDEAALMSLSSSEENRLYNLMFRRSILHRVVRRTF